MQNFIAVAPPVERSCWSEKGVFSPQPSLWDHAQLARVVRWLNVESLTLDIMALRAQTSSRAYALIRAGVAGTLSMDTVDWIMERYGL